MSVKRGTYSRYYGLSTVIWFTARGLRDLGRVVIADYREWLKALKFRVLNNSVDPHEFEGTGFLLWRSMCMLLICNLLPVVNGLMPVRSVRIGISSPLAASLPGLVYSDDYGSMWT